jgi:hypothetical protein
MTLVHIGCYKHSLERRLAEPCCTNLVWTNLGTFEALEALRLGILGKRALWQALAVVAEGDGRLRGMDFHHLAARAQAQHTQVEERRLEAAPTALRAAPQ